MIHVSTEKKKDGTEKLDEFGNTVPAVIREKFDVNDGWIRVQQANGENCNEILTRARACDGKKEIWRDSEHFAKTFAFFGEESTKQTDEWVRAFKEKQKKPVVSSAPTKRRGLLSCL